MTDSSSAPAPGSIDELADLYPVPAKVEAGGKIIEISPPSIRKLGRASDIIRRIRKSREEAGESELLTIESLVATNTDELIALVAIATGEPEQFIGDLPSDEFAKLASKAFEVWLGFLLAKVAPTLATVAAGLALLSGGRDGSTSLPAS